MKSHRRIQLVLVLSVLVLLVPSLTYGEEQKDEENILRDDRPRYGKSELTEERIEHMMGQIAENDPAKAKELAKILEENPEKFKVELHKYMRGQFSRRGGGGRSGRGGPDGERGMRRGGSSRGGRGMHEGHIEWLKKNYPEKAEQLEKLREENPELYMRKVSISNRRYGKIAAASKKNPKLAELLKKNLTLNDERDKLVRKIRSAEDAAEKAKLVVELKEILGQKFDVIVERKRIEYEQLTKRLENMKKEVEKSELNVAKWKTAEFKQKNVESRLEELLSEKQKFEW